MSNTQHKKWKYIVGFSYVPTDDLSNESSKFILFNAADDQHRLEAMMAESSFSGLLLKMTIAGIDLVDVNFNKVSMMSEVEKTLVKSKIPHLHYYGSGEEPAWVTYG